MKCYHRVPIGYDFSVWQVAWDGLPVPTAGPKAIFAVHKHAHECPDPSSAMPHILDSSSQVGAKVAAALADFGVTATDTPSQAVLKVGAKWRPALP